MTQLAPDLEAPPGGEQLHMPGPSIIPFLSAIGVAVAVVGLTTYGELIVAGGLLVLVTTVRWVRDVIRDVAELPADHSSH